MKTKKHFLNPCLVLLFVASMCGSALDGSAQGCSQSFVYGLSNAGMIRRITINNGGVQVAMNPAHAGNAASYSNAMGYNPLNGKYYFFKRNSFVSPQEFMSFDPATNLYQMLAPSPVGAGNIINLGCVNNTGLGYYCLDAMGALYYYNVATNSWRTICTNIRNQFNTTLFSIIDPMGLQRYYGDIAIDGMGNMWMLISGPVDYGLYKINGPLPTAAVANLTARQILAPTTASPGGSFGGMAFSATGDLYVSSNSPDNRLYRLSASMSLTVISNLAVDGIGNDLTSCNFPLEVLASEKIQLSATVVNKNTAVIKWNISQSSDGSSYVVEHSTDGSTWDEINNSVVIANNGVNTSVISQKNLAIGTHYYRIRKAAPNGVITYSAIEKVTIGSLTTINIWPNPAQRELKVQDMGNGSGTSWIFLYDYTGKMISRSLMKPGVNSIAIESLPAGTYIARVQHSSGEIMNRKFLKQ
jgi:hypothetical protein